MLVLRWNQRAHYWFLGRPKGHIRGTKGHIRGTKGHSALWKRPSENPDHEIMYSSILWLSDSCAICSEEEGATYAATTSLVPRLSPMYERVWE